MCAAACDSYSGDDACNAFDFNPDDNGCWLKKGCDGTVGGGIGYKRVCPSSVQVSESKGWSLNETHWRLQRYSAVGSFFF
jgi:hypothetical protein